MSSEQIGVVQYSQPRTEKVRAPGNMNDIHSAVHGTIAIHTDTQEQTKAIMENWPQFMSALDTKISDFIFEWEMQNPDKVPYETTDPGDTYTGPTFRESDD